MPQSGGRFELVDGEESGSEIHRCVRFKGIEGKLSERPWRREWRTRGRGNEEMSSGGCESSDLLKYFRAPGLMNRI